MPSSFALTKIRAAFPHKEGPGFSVELRAFPMDRRLVALRHAAWPSRHSVLGTSFQVNST
jgi:hypothetical protein